MAAFHGTGLLAMASLLVASMVGGGVRAQVLGTYVHSTNTGYSSAVAVSNNIAYIASCDQSRLDIVDVQDVSNPTSLGELTGISCPVALALQGNITYLCCGDKLASVDVSDPASPALMQSVSPSWSCSNLALSGNYVYLSGELLQSYNVSDPSQMNLVGQIERPPYIQGQLSFEEAEDVAILGNYAYLTQSDPGAVAVVDVSDPANLSILSTLQDARLQGAGSVAAASNVNRGQQPPLGYADCGNAPPLGPGDMLYVVCRDTQSLVVLDLSYVPSSPLSFYTSGNGGVFRDTANIKTGGNGVVPMGDLVYVSSFPGSLLAVNVLYPWTPTLSSAVSGSGFGGGPMAVSGDHAFIPSEDMDSHDMTIVSLLPATTTTQRAMLSSMPSLHGLVSGAATYAWTEVSNMGNMRSLRAITSSADGTKLAVAGSDPEFIWTSGDSGDTWTELSNIAGESWRSITSSTDGTKLAAVEYNGLIWTSQDSGASWTAVRLGTENWWSETGEHNWYAITSSADGTKLAAATLKGNDPTLGGNNQPGSMWTSGDSGATWTEVVSGPGAQEEKWQSITSSADGTKLAAAGWECNIWIRAIASTTTTATATTTMTMTSTMTTTMTSTFTSSSTSTLATVMSTGGGSTQSSRSSGMPSASWLLLCAIFAVASIFHT